MLLFQLWCEIDIPRQHGCDARDLLLPRHEFLGSVRLKFKSYFFRHSSHHGQKVHTFPILPQGIHESLNEPRSPRGVAPCKEAYNTQSLSRWRTVPIHPAIHSVPASYWHTSTPNILQFRVEHVGQHICDLNRTKRGTISLSLSMF